LGLLLAHRPRIRQVVDVGEIPTDLRDAAIASIGRRSRLLS
jgi:hypothetical protein